MSSNSDAYNNEKDTEPTDPIATMLFLVFASSLAYLVIANSVGIYPWAIILNVIFLIPTWEAVITFLSILTIMFVTLIGGLIKMRYSIVLIGFITLIAVFVITFYAMFLFAWLTTLSYP